MLYGYNMKSRDRLHSLAKNKAQDKYDAFSAMKPHTYNVEYIEYIIELFAGTLEEGNYVLVQIKFENDGAIMGYIDGLRPPFHI